MSNPSDFPPDTVLGNIRLSVFANDSDGAVNIFHEGYFKEPLVSLEYYAKDRDLVFIFEGDIAMSLGSVMDKSLIPFVLDAEEVAVFRLENGDPVDGVRLPLEIVED